jgi:hypothetical protein
VIQDPKMKENLLQEWHFVRRSQGLLQSRAVATLGGSSPGLVGMYDEYYALLIVLGFAVLDHALHVIGDQKTFEPKGWQLGKLMQASLDGGVAWRNFPAIDGGRNARNDLAHRQIIPKVADTFRMLNEIEAELIGWNILPAPVEYLFKLSISRTS